jgi:hypothetical protein
MSARPVLAQFSEADRGAGVTILEVNGLKRIETDMQGDLVLPQQRPIGNW